LTVQAVVLRLCICFAFLFTDITTGASPGNQPALLHGQLIAADTKKPIANAVVSATSKTRPPRTVKVRTAADGSFALPVESGLPYALCSDSAGKYVSTCTFSKPVTAVLNTAVSNNAARPILLSASPGIQMRLQIHDPGRRVRVSRLPRLSADPLDLLVYAEENTTRTRVAVPISKEMPDGFEYTAVIPALPTWRLSVNSARLKLIASTGSQSSINDGVPVPPASDAEVLTVFSIAGK
jgi:hypothetical protein